MKFITGFVLGALLVISPDLIMLYEERIIRLYSQKGCADLKDKTKCTWNRNNWYDKYKTDHILLNKIGNNIQLGEGPLYWILSKRCTNKIFYNISATKDSGKITNREYFSDRCSKLNIVISDFLFGD